MREDTSYRPRVVRHIRSLMRRNAASDFTVLARSAKGLFPSELLEIIRSEGLKIDLPQESHPQDRLTPNPSPATAEWFFTNTSANCLARNLPGRTLCLGTPSIAAAKADLGEPATLVDLSPWASERFNLSSPLLDLRLGQAVEHTVFGEGYDSAILDPPWYFPTLADWLQLASSRVRPGGRILMPLLGEFTRPAAVSDRERLFDFASTIGPWSLAESSVLYDTPHFERRALERSGIYLSEPWRCSDLLSITNEHPASPPRFGSSGGANWSTIRLGNSLVSLRQASSQDPQESDGPQILEEVMILDSVSRRNPSIVKANVWTSENTAAVCSDLNALRVLLESDSNRLGALDFTRQRAIAHDLELEA